MTSKWRRCDVTSHWHHQYDGVTTSCACWEFAPPPPPPPPPFYFLDLGSPNILNLPTPYGPVATLCQIYDQTQLIMPLTIWNCVLSYQQKNNFSKNWHALWKNYFYNRIPRWQLFATNNLNRYQMRFLGGKVATVNFEPCIVHHDHGATCQKQYEELLWLIISISVALSVWFLLIFKVLTASDKKG